MSIQLNEQEARIVAAMMSGEKLSVSEIEHRARAQANSFHARKFYLRKKGYVFDKQLIRTPPECQDYYVYWMVSTPSRRLGPTHEHPGQTAARIREDTPKDPKKPLRKSCKNPNCQADEFYWDSIKRWEAGSRKTIGYQCGVCGELMDRYGRRAPHLRSRRR